MDCSTLQIFDCPAYNLVDNQKRNKLESKSKRCTFIGFVKSAEGFRLWNHETSTFSNRDVFDKKLILQEKSKTVDKAEGGNPISSADSQIKDDEFSGGPKSIYIVQS